MNKLLSTAICTLVAAEGATAAELNLKIEIPQLEVAEYHRPYVAIWLESADRKTLTNLAVWYDLKLKNNEGTKWLKDLRQWWRRSGRELNMPVDGISGATRAPGEQTISFGGRNKDALSQLPPGEYRLYVEAAREVGGREMVEIPLQWPPKETKDLKAQGEHELGKVSATLKP